MFPEPSGVCAFNFFDLSPYKLDHSLWARLLHFLRFDRASLYVRIVSCVLVFLICLLALFMILVSTRSSSSFSANQSLLFFSSGTGVSAAALTINCSDTGLLS